jgi:hypothetical protein
MLAKKKLKTETNARSKQQRQTSHKTIKRTVCLSSVDVSNHLLKNISFNQYYVCQLPSLCYYCRCWSTVPRFCELVHKDTNGTDCSDSVNFDFSSMSGLGARKLMIDPSLFYFVRNATCHWQLDGWYASRRIIIANGRKLRHRNHLRCKISLQIHFLGNTGPS